MFMLLTTVCDHQMIDDVTGAANRMTDGKVICVAPRE